MRKAWLPPVLIFIGILAQLTMLDGLRLPGGGVPDLVLVLVAALAIAQGPLAGLIIGFAAGLCLDLAPPGSALIGQYAFVFCLAGWVAGRLSGGARRSPLRLAMLMGLVVAAAEAVVAGLGRALVPAEVSVAEIRAVLPVSILYDLLLCPFALYLVVLVGGKLAGAPLTPVALGGTMQALVRARRTADRKGRARQPRLREAAARTGDGWLGGAPRGHYGTRAVARPSARLRPGNGVPGSASGLARHPGRAASAPVNLRMASGRRGDAAIGTAVGAGLRPHQQPGSHPGLLAGRSRFRPRGGELGGSATRSHGVARASSPRGQTPIRFSAHRGDASVGRSLGSGWGATPGRRVSTGPRPGSGWLSAASRPVSPGPQLRLGARRSAITAGGSPAAVPKLHFKSAPPPAARRPVAVPRFRRKSALLRPSTPVSGLVSGGALDGSTFRAVRRRTNAPRLRLASRGRATGMLGGSGGSALRQPAARMRKQPKFGYGKRSLLSFPTVRRMGGQWLARKRAGSRSGSWLIGSRQGGSR
ncbi:MAG TPA: rod shape-determining protein MreD [Streptosporangiaceae bacterium]|nr:rod shape-determining protein MreD [Streptosporangiaceae bacterium]